MIACVICELLKPHIKQSIVGLLIAILRFVQISGIGLEQSVTVHKYLILINREPIVFCIIFDAFRKHKANSIRYWCHCFQILDNIIYIKKFQCRYLNIQHFNFEKYAV